uniref:Uncharacterized protein n=1 Tax=Candidatus Kentrum sp. TC TaxID=2126339 RepID=A0A450YZ56_9GAMM|nr:MAG: hypothetical protein BECKTC1821E_GA0114239_10709 [Candidatus Kentron sp. TC]
MSIVQGTLHRGAKVRLTAFEDEGRSVAYYPPLNCDLHRIRDGRYREEYQNDVADIVADIDMVTAAIFQEYEDRAPDKYRG